MKNEDDTRRGQSRRDFLAGSATAIAAGTAIGMMSGTTNAAVAPPEPDSPDTSVRWKTEPGGLYNEKSGYLKTKFHTSPGEKNERAHVLKHILALLYQRHELFSNEPNY